MHCADRPPILATGSPRCWTDGNRIRVTPGLSQARADLALNLAPDHQWTILGRAYAGLGRAEDAIREGNRAVRALPVSVDAFYGVSYLWDRAAIYGMLGDSRRAAAQLRELLDRPCYLSPAFLEKDFHFDGVRGDPEFQEILSAPTSYQ